MMTTLQAGKLVPMFTLPTNDGKQQINRSDLRGKAALLMVWMPPLDDNSQSYLQSLDSEAATWSREQRALVISDEDLPACKHLTVLRDAEHTVATQFFEQPATQGAWFITDRYGELYAQGTAATTADLPAPATFSEWLEYVNMRCGG